VKMLAMVLATDPGTHLDVLSQTRPKPALPFAGKYRLIDFVLSNCGNSDIYTVGILTQYWPYVLNEHIRTGRPWGLDRELSGGVTLLPPYQQSAGTTHWYLGAADALYQNLDFILAHQSDTVLVLPGDQVYEMDYNQLLRYHQEHQATVTICTVRVAPEATPHHYALRTDQDGRVLEFLPESQSPDGLVSTDICLFQTDALVQSLTRDAGRSDSTHDLGRAVLPHLLARGERLESFFFDGYWTDVDTVPSYWQAHMDLLRSKPSVDLADPHWSIHTHSQERPPAIVHPGGSISGSLITDGCVIEGSVQRSVLCPGVQIGAGAIVRDSVLLENCVIGSGAILDSVILDENVVVGANARIGCDPETPSQSHKGSKLDAGITLVGKNTRLPADLCVGRSCILSSDLLDGDFVTGPPVHVNKWNSPNGRQLESEH
jgi:glucose-1-phosphate adenylyltransferase